LGGYPWQAVDGGGPGQPPVTAAAKQVAAMAAPSHHLTVRNARIVNNMVKPQFYLGGVGVMAFSISDSTIEHNTVNGWYMGISNGHGACGACFGMRLCTMDSATNHRLCHG
jgi:hypothetical protein